MVGDVEDLQPAGMLVIERADREVHQIVPLTAPRFGYRRLPLQANHLGWNRIGGKHPADRRLFADAVERENGEETVEPLSATLANVQSNPVGVQYRLRRVVCRIKQGRKREDGRVPGCRSDPG